MSTTYTAIAHNAQGASDEIKCKTKYGVNAWLSNWTCPQHLTVQVRDAEGREVAQKEVGRKTIPWTVRG